MEVLANKGAILSCQSGSIKRNASDQSSPYSGKVKTNLARDNNDAFDLDLEDLNHTDYYNALLNNNNSNNYLEGMSNNNFMMMIATTS